jgi:hypothetical protein
MFQKKFHFGCQVQLVRKIASQTGIWEGGEPTHELNTYQIMEEVKENQAEMLWGCLIN